MVKVEGHLRNHILPVFGNRALGSIQPFDVRSWVATLTTGDLAPDTVKAIYLTFGQILKMAEIDRLIARSPCLGITLPKPRATEEMHFLAPQEVDRLAEAITPRFRTVIYTAAYGGLRAGELAALKTERLHVAQGTLDVVESMSEHRGGLVTGPPKNGKRRSPPSLGSW